MSIRISSQFIICLLITICCFSCKNDSKSPPSSAPVTIDIPVFNEDMAYRFIEKQVSFGPRVPNSPAHDSCAAWLKREFHAIGARVVVQHADLKAYTGEILRAQNIIAVYNPDAKRRVILAAHWDSRHMAEWDADPNKRMEPILGADDGGSGVGVLLEIARNLDVHKIEGLGVDIVLFDAEDIGQPRGGGGFPEQKDTWCLGSQHWSRNKHQSDYRAMYGILLDMVGSKNARFPREEVSMQYAPDVVNKVWTEAQKAGYSSYFDFAKAPGVTDDHLYVNQIAKIPMIDIINRPVTSETGFGHYWHTHKDDMSVIDKQTLKAVGQTVLNVLYKEAAGVL